MIPLLVLAMMYARLRDVHVNMDKPVTNRLLELR